MSSLDDYIHTQIELQTENEMELKKLAKNKNKRSEIMEKKLTKEDVKKLADMGYSTADIFEMIGDNNVKVEDVPEKKEKKPSKPRNPGKSAFGKIKELFETAKNKYPFFKKEYAKYSDLLNRLDELEKQAEEYKKNEILERFEKNRAKKWEGKSKEDLNAAIERMKREFELANGK